MPLVYLPTRVRIHLPPMRERPPEPAWTNQPGEDDDAEVTVIGAAQAPPHQNATPEQVEAAIAARKLDVALAPSGAPSLSLVTLRPYQTEAIEAVAEQWGAGKQAPLLVLPTGCHRAGQLVRMGDGSVKAVEDVREGDVLASYHGRQRTVLRLCRGIGRMVEVVPKAGDPWVVNEDHVLTVSHRPLFPSLHNLVDISVREFLNANVRERDYVLVRFLPSGGVTSTSFELRLTGTVEPYYGFMLDGDHRYLLDDFTVTHNSGKTIIAAEILRRFTDSNPAKRGLFIAHRKELLEQTVAKIKLVAPRTTVGLVQAKHNEAARRLVVASVQTLARGQRMADIAKHGEIGIVIVDECFVRGTLVDNTPIERLRDGDTVSAWCEETGAFTEARVTRVMRTVAPSHLFKIEAGGRTLIGTRNHPVMTRNGWMELGYLTTSDEVLLHEESTLRSVWRSEPEASIDHATVLLSTMCRESSRGAAQEVDRELRGVRNSDRADQTASGRSQKGGPRLLLEVVRSGGPPPGLICHDGENQQTLRSGADARAESDDQGNVSGEDARDAADRGPLATREGRQWAPCHGPGDDTGVGAGCELGHASDRADRDPRTWNADALQDRHRECGDEDRGRGRRPITSSDLQTRGGRQEGRVSSWTRVDRVQVLERGRDEEYDRVCPDGAVYNLEVEGLHTYTANGVVVHNCHHAPSPTYRRVLSAIRERYPGIKLVGVTATPGREDGTALDSVFDVIAFERNLFDMIRDGWLVPPVGVRVELDLDFDSVDTDDDGEFRKAGLSKLMNKPAVNHAIVEAWGRFGQDRKMLAFCVDVQHAKDLAAAFREHGFSASHIDGAMKDAEREKNLRDFREGRIKILANCEIAIEGYDDPSTEGIIMARPTQSQALFIQAVGRGLRLYPGKTDCLVLDIVGNSDRHQLVQLASLAGLDPLRASVGDGDPFADDDDDNEVIIASDEEDPEVSVDDVRGRHVDFHRLARRQQLRYQWRETPVGWVLMVPRVGYLLVAFHASDRTKATIRFHDTRKGRKETPPQDVTTGPVDFEMAYGLAEGFVERLLRAANSQSRWKDVPSEDDMPMHWSSLLDLDDDGVDADVAAMAQRTMESNAAWRSMPPTQKQLDLLRRLGVKDKDLPKLSGECGDLITILEVERDLRMRLPATSKQLGFLRGNKIPFEPGITKGQARRLIVEHKHRGGRS